VRKKPAKPALPALPHPTAAQRSRAYAPGRARGEAGRVFIHGKWYAVGRAGPAPKPPVVISGGRMVPVPAKKPAAKKKPAKRKLARAGENCVLDACYALTGHRPDLGSEDGVLIPAALEMLAAAGLISGFAPADLDDDSPALILGVSLPGPHAVLTIPGGAWWSWGEPRDPADFPDAVVEEAWQVTW
jgi:hypothetical protein